MMHDYGSREIAAQPEEPRASFVLLSFLTLFFTAVFFVNDADWQVSTYEHYALSADSAESQVATGSSWRQISYLTIGAVGLALTIVPGRQRVNFVSLPFALLWIYVLLCLVSCLWSDAAWLTTKRLVTLVFGLLAIIGLAKQLSIRDLIDLSLGIATILLIVSLYAELRLGTFAPWTGGYRFSGIVHPNQQAANCGLMVMAAFFGMKVSRRGKFVYFGLLVLAAGFLLLTKSRTSVAACLLGVSAAWYFFASRKQQTLVGLALPAAVCAGLAAMLLLGVELTSSATTAASFGRGADQDLMTLNGRIPLWAYLIEHIAEQPLLGYGYQGFWTPDRIYEVSLEQEWTVPNGHSVFLDVLLSTGLVGGTIFGLGVVTASYRIIKRCRETMAPTDCFVLALFVFSFIGAFVESSFEPPSGFEAFMTSAALLHVISRRTQAESTTQATNRHADPRSNWKAVSTGGLA